MRQDIEKAFSAWKAAQRRLDPPSPYGDLVALKAEVKRARDAFHRLCAEAREFDITAAAVNVPARVAKLANSV